MGCGSQITPFVVQRRKTDRETDEFNHEIYEVHEKSVPDLARLVIKRFPENRNLQLVGLRMPARFHCSRCKTSQRANVLAVVSGDWGQLLCRACYEKLLSEPPSSG